MKTFIWRFYAFLLPWILLIRYSGCQSTVFLTLIEDKCITNTSAAMAMIYDLNHTDLVSNFRQMREDNKFNDAEISKILPMDNSSEGVNSPCFELDCFKLRSWTIEDSLGHYHIDNLITDRRWEDLETVVTKHIVTKEQYLNYEMAAQIPNPDSSFLSIPFSVQVKEEAHVFICEENSVPNSFCLWFMLQAWDSRYSGVRKCRKNEIQPVYDGNAPMGNCNRSTSRTLHDHDYPKYLKEDQWRHFKIVKTSDMYYLKNQNDDILIESDTTNFVIKPAKFLFFHTKSGSGLWKVHKFKYFYTDKEDAELESRKPLVVLKGHNCLSMFVVMCEECYLEISLLSRAKVLAKKPVSFQVNGWKEIKSTFFIEENNEVYLRIISKSNSSKKETNFWAINNIRPCNLNEIRVLTPTFPQMWTKKCQLMPRFHLLDLNKPKNISKLGNWKRCGEHEFGEQCLPCELFYKDTGVCPPATSYCQLIKEESNKPPTRCYCSAGYQGDTCKDPCNRLSKYSYGHGCQKICENCKDTCSRDSISGKCDSERCKGDYLGEKCDVLSKIFFFNDLPEIEIGNNSCILSMTSFTGKGALALQRYYKFEYREKNGKDWMDVIDHKLIFNVTEQVALENLRLGEIYFVRVFGFESDTTLNEDLSHVSKYIQVRRFTTCIDINENHVRVETGINQASFNFNIDEETLIKLKMCNLSSYTFTFGNKLVSKDQHDKYSILKLEPYTTYSVEVRKNTKILFLKTFTTKESVPEEVQNFEVHKPHNSTLLKMTWSRPRKTNGILLYYTISFKLKKYQACQNSAEHEEFESFIDASQEKWEETRLKPYAEYLIEIKANTSAGFGTTVQKTIETDPMESIKPEELPERIDINPESYYVTFKFITPSCYKMAGPIYIRTNLTTSKSWCKPHISELPGTVNRPLHFTGLAPFCEYDVLFTFFRMSGKNEINITKNFTTLEAVPRKVTDLEVTSKGNDYIALRWLPPYPPTGNLSHYKLQYCTKHILWNRCKDQEIPVVPCQIWENYHCWVLTGLQNKVSHFLKIQSKNQGNAEYSKETNTVIPIFTDDNEKSQPPYGLSMKWTQDNHLIISWYHPNQTNGNLTGFHIKVNNIEYEYKIDPKNNYTLIYSYNVTITAPLLLPDNYTVKVAAQNPAGNSDWSIINGISPPPIPQETVGKIETKGVNILIPFKPLTKTKVNYERFLYVYITECDKCNATIIIDKLQRGPLSPNTVQATDKHAHWKGLQDFNYSEAYTKYPKNLFIGKDHDLEYNERVKYNVKANKNYSILLIWIHRLKNAVRTNHMILVAHTQSVTHKTSFNGKTTFIGKTTVALIIILIALAMTLVYTRWRQEINQKMKQIFGCTSESVSSEIEYDIFMKRNEAVSLRNNNIRNSSGLKETLESLDTSCPGCPLFKTTNSRRVKLDVFEQYVKNAILSKELQRQHNLFPSGLIQPYSYGALPENKEKNRYNNLTAYNHSRVVLKKLEGKEFSDYINASYVDGYGIPRAYIATQGPNKNTVGDFWRMIWQEKVSWIVMMANVYEGGKKKTEQYWPNDGEMVTFDNLMITFISTEIHANYECRKFKLHCRFAKAREVGQLHFKAWPDHGVPLYPQSLVPILQKMLTFGTNSFPIVVHCSAGVGRTGTVILCDICLRMAAAEGHVDVLSMLEHLRNQRANMVDNPEQYKLAHLVILNCLLRTKTSIPINRNFNRAVQDLLQDNSVILSQLQYVRNCEWEDDAMKTVSYIDGEEMPVCPDKNRFVNIVPDKAARVYLQPYPATDSSLRSTYINAVHVDSFGEPRRFIVTQYPLQNTVGDFWRLVAERNITVIVCLTNVGRGDPSYGAFFPERPEEELSPMDAIRVKYVKKRSLQTYNIFTLHLTVCRPYQEALTSTVEIVKFKGWKITQKLPDYTDFVAFVEDATNIARKSTPTLVTCFNGATGSGLFIAMTFIMEKIKLEQECDVCQAVRSIRISRKQFTNTEDQIKFLYKAALFYVDDRFSRYSNMDLLT